MYTIVKQWHYQCKKIYLENFQQAVQKIREKEKILFLLRTFLVMLPNINQDIDVRLLPELNMQGHLLIMPFVQLNKVYEMVSYRKTIYRCFSVCVGDEVCSRWVTSQGDIVYFISKHIQCPFPWQAQHCAELWKNRFNISPYFC